MNNTNAVEIAIITGVVTILVAVLTFVLNHYSSKRKKSLELKIQYIERQMELLYGPLFSLLAQLCSLRDVKDKIDKKYINKKDELNRIDAFFNRNYFTPIHERIKEIISSNLYLINENKIPNSFLAYLRHVSQDKAQRELYERERIETSHIKGEMFPYSFKENIENNMKVLKQELSELRESLGKKII
ncbi:hypothetical protein [Parabacteroides pacaensis]|uniref:hypothetical protein n=1 Tax=Parabacteroides pacaensis TaxID=2086575 RepID=UPI000D0F801E|nr:hypothetical protein [Parabacteroides pacaensis]